MRASYRSLLALLFFAAFAATPFSGASALTVSVAPAQDPVYPADDEEAPTPIGSLVTGCLGTFFDAGLIATDARSARIPAAEWEFPSFGLDGARDGRVDYLVALFAAWKPSAFKKGAWLLSSVRYRLMRVSDGATLASGSLEGPLDSEAVAQAAERSAISIGTAIASACAAVLGPGSLGGK